MTLYYLVDEEQREGVSYEREVWNECWARAQLRNTESWQVSQLDRETTWYSKVMGSIPGQGTCKNQAINA